VEVVEPDRVFLLTETRSFVLTGRGYRHAAPLLDGTRTADEIVEALADRIPAPETRVALALLLERGYISTRAGSSDPGLEAFWHLQELDPTSATDRLAASPVSVRALGSLSLAVLTSVDDALRDGPDAER
jgi:oxazoline/thiazoline synthase